MLVTIGLKIIPTAQRETTRTRVESVQENAARTFVDVDGVYKQAKLPKWFFFTGPSGGMSPLNAAPALNSLQDGATLVI